MAATIKQQAMDFYRADVQALSDLQLARILRGEGLEPGIHRSVRAALESLACDTLIERGHLLPHLYAMTCEF